MTLSYPTETFQEHVENSACARSAPRVCLFLGVGGGPGERKELKVFPGWFPETSQEARADFYGVRWNTGGGKETVKWLQLCSVCKGTTEAGRTSFPWRFRCHILTHCQTSLCHNEYVFGPQGDRVENLSGIPRDSTGIPLGVHHDSPARSHLDTPGDRAESSIVR